MANLEQEERDVLKYIELGLVSELDTFLNSHPNFDVNSNSGNFLLEAVRNGNRKIAQTLIDHGANVNITLNDSNWKPLHYALKDPKMTQLLVDNGADVNAKCSFDGSDEVTPLMIANHHSLSVTKILVENGADVNASLHYDQVEIESYPLNLAISNGDFERAAYLIKHGANPNARGYAGRTLLQDSLADSIEGPKETEAEFLIEHGADPYLKDDEGKTAVDYLKEYAHKHLEKDFSDLERLLTTPRESKPQESEKTMSQRLSKAEVVFQSLDEEQQDAIRLLNKAGQNVTVKYSDENNKEKTFEFVAGERNIHGALKQNTK